jgi:U3 small nucleolar ribonucleoprotein protein IMP4
MQPQRGPLILVTTSRAPSPRTRSLVKDLLLVLPRSERLTRGHLTLDELAALARSRGARRVVIVGERRGNPSIIRVYTPTEPPEPPRLVNIVTFKVAGVSLSRERGAVGSLRPRLLIVEPDEASEDVADAFVIGLLARLPRGPHGRGGARGVVLAKLNSMDTGEVIADFRLLDGRPVGPRLRLVRPERMVKVGRA